MQLEPVEGWLSDAAEPAVRAASRRGAGETPFALAAVKILVDAVAREFVKARHGAAQLVGVDAQGSRESRQVVGPRDRAGNLRAGRQMGERIVRGILRVEDQPARKIDVGVRE